MAHEFVSYLIYLADPAEVATQQALYPNGISGLSPQTAATQFSAPLGGQTPGGAWTPPGIMIPWAGYAFDQSVASGAVPGTAWTDPFGNHYPATTFEWIGYFLMASGVAAVTPPGEALRQRRWVHGFEMPEGGEGGSIGTAFGSHVNRDASRTAEGYGLAWRGQTQSFTQTCTEFTGGGTSTFRATWERLYIRLRRQPTAATVFWRSRGSVSNSAGMALKITTSGSIELHGVDAANVFTLQATSAALTINQWVRLDIVHRFFDGVNRQGAARVYKSGVLMLQDTGAATPGINQQQFHASSELGNATAGNDIELDFDDWIGSDSPSEFQTSPAGAPPAQPPISQYTGLDWLSGSHAQVVHPNGLDVSTAGWTGDYRVLLSDPAFRGTAQLTSATSGARLAATTDATLIQQRQGAQLGCCAFLVGIYSHHAGGVDGQLGYSLNGTEVLATIDEGAGFRWNSVLYRPSGLATPVPIEPVLLIHTKGASVDAAEVRMLLGEAEYLGAWGPEDAQKPVKTLTRAGNVASAITWIPHGFTSGQLVTMSGASPVAYNGLVTITVTGASTFTYPILGAPGTPASGAILAIGMNFQPNVGIHNAPYWHTGWELSGAGSPPFSPVIVEGGLYVGDGLGKAIALAGPGYWWWVRPLTGAAGGGHWWTSIIAAHNALDIRGLEPELMPQALLDSLNVSQMQVAGANTQGNAAGVSYQYIVVSDPGMRYLLNGAFAHAPTVASMVNTLIDPSFWAEAAFLFQEQIGVNGSVDGMWYKGVGHALDRASVLNLAEASNVLSFDLGLLISQTPLHTADQSIAHSLWRRHDGDATAAGPSPTNADPANVGIVVQLTSYVGDGAGGVRNISLDLGGRFPLFAIVVPHNGASYTRDPSHTGANSMRVDNSGNTTTGITGGGADLIKVGVTLNTLNVLYDVFVIPGSGVCSTADGWSCNGTFYPVAPSAARLGSGSGSPWAPNPVPTPPEPEPGGACVVDFPVDLA